VCADRHLVEIAADGGKVAQAANGVCGVIPVPDWDLGVQPVRKAKLDQVYGVRERHPPRSKNQVDMVGHDQVGVEFVVALRAVMEQGRDK